MIAHVLRAGFSSGLNSGRLALVSRSSRQTEAVGRLVAAQGCSPGDVVLLRGGVGVGKSVLAQGFIREAVGDPHLVVPSPTFLREHRYARADGCSIHHLDLYRCGTDSDAASLSLEDIFETGTCLLEWPDAALALLPLKFLTVTMTESFPEQVMSKITADRGHLDRQGLGVAICMDVDDQSGLQDETEDGYVRILELAAHGDVWVDRLQLLRNAVGN